MNGLRQAALLAKWPKGVVLPNGNAERCACWRLVRRGVLEPVRFGNGQIGYTTVYLVVAP